MALELLPPAPMHGEVAKPDISSSATVIEKTHSVSAPGSVEAANSLKSPAVSSEGQVSSKPTHSARVPEHATAQAMRMVADVIEKYSPEFM